MYTALEDTVLCSWNCIIYLVDTLGLLDSAILCLKISFLRDKAGESWFAKRISVFEDELRNFFLQVCVLIPQEIRIWENGRQESFVLVSLFKERVMSYNIILFISDHLSFFLDIDYFNYLKLRWGHFILPKIFLEYSPLLEIPIFKLFSQSTP